MRYTIVRKLSVAILGLIIPVWLAACALAADAPSAGPSSAPKTNAKPAAGDSTKTLPNDPTENCIWPKFQDAFPTAYAHAALTILPATRWQPFGGDVQFEITGLAAPLDQAQVFFAWQSKSNAKPSECLPSLRLRLLPIEATDNSNTYRYAARVPRMSDSGDAFLPIDGFDDWDFTRSTVPMADMFVRGNITSDQKVAIPVVFTASFGITTPWIALTTALVGAVLVCGVLAWWARLRKIPGGFFLSIITTPQGVASLSQFQILIWTIVIGAGVVYVMMLSGNLIDIPTSMLGLLGVTGFALVGAKLKANADGSPQRANAPGAVMNVTLLGTPTADTVVLSWTPPAGADQPFGYTVQARNAGMGVWSGVANNIAGPPYAVTGLDAGTSYEFQVFAMNAGGAGPASVPLTVLTGVVPIGPVPVARVTGLNAVAELEGSVTLTWAALAPAPKGYTTQYRPAGTLPWATGSNNAKGQATLRNLDRGTNYEFQVFAVAGGVSGPPSDLATAKIAVREPSWSDLVMSTDGSTEVDLSRLQMLVFTGITAVFTALTLINTGVIPELPVSELALVGISNGVYLASKASSRGR